MPLFALGLNHQTAPVSLRERVAITDGQIEDALRSLRAQPGIIECAVIPTCNRTEIYAHTEDENGHSIGQWLAHYHSVSHDSLDTYLYLHQGDAAVRHLFRVATGLDSLVLGEPQILGQVKQSWQIARNSGSLQTSLDRLFQQCFAVAKKVRTDTAIGAHPVSVAFAAVRLAQQTFSAIDQSTVLLIGAGDTIELAAKHLHDANAKRILVANRTLEHAQSLASRVGAYAFELSELDRHLHEADLVISATASRAHVLSRDSIQQALIKRRHRPMFLLDLAVPRDIEASASELQDVFLYTVDDLQRVIEDNRASRREAAAQAEALIDLQVEHFMSWWHAQSRQTALIMLRAHGQQTRDQLLARALEQLNSGEQPSIVIEHLANQITNKLLHAPSAALRQAALSGDFDLLRTAMRLYQLEENDTDPPA